MSTVERSAMEAGLLSCAVCRLVTRPATGESPGYCPRCGAALAWRHPNAIQYTWALLVAATICYIPANLLPVLTTTTLGETESATIMEGVFHLYESGSWALALIVFVASIVIPGAKIAALSYLCVTVQRGSAGNLRDRRRIYDLVEFVGRWSMLDVFVAAYIVALIQLQPLMSVEPGAGVVFFMVVVVLTMLAAQAFDPRLIWDAAAHKAVRHG